MASVTIDAKVLTPSIFKKFEHTSHIELVFLQEGFALANWIRKDEVRERILIIFTKKELLDWKNKTQKNIITIGKSHFDSLFTVRL